jgi:hypothetical protein
MARRTPERINMINLARCTYNYRLPGAFFSNAVTYLEFAPERHQYEAAVQAFAAETSPAALRQTVEALRRRGFRATQAQARENAADRLRSDLTKLGYRESEIQWHAARRSRRDRTYFSAMRAH